MGWRANQILCWLMRNVWGILFFKKSPKSCVSGDLLLEHRLFLLQTSPVSMVAAVHISDLHNSAARELKKMTNAQGGRTPRNRF